jgi:hypothetical protein
MLHTTVMKKDFFGKAGLLRVSYRYIFRSEKYFQGYLTISFYEGAESCRPSRYGSGANRPVTLQAKPTLASDAQKGAEVRFRPWTVGI